MLKTKLKNLNYHNILQLPVLLIKAHKSTNFVVTYKSYKITPKQFIGHNSNGQEGGRLQNGKKESDHQYHKIQKLS